MKLLSQGHMTRGWLCWACKPRELPWLSELTSILHSLSWVGSYNCLLLTPGAEVVLPYVFKGSGEMFSLPSPRGPWLLPPVLLLVETDCKCWGWPGPLGLKELHFCIVVMPLCCDLRSVSGSSFQRAMGYLLMEYVCICSSVITRGGSGGGLI